MRSRSLLSGMLGRGRERTPHHRARSLTTGPTRPTHPGIIAADFLSSPAKWLHRNRGRPYSVRFVSKSDTKEPNHFLPSHTNRGIMRFYQTHSVLVAAFVSDLDTPHLSKALSTSGTT